MEKKIIKIFQNGGGTIFRSFSRNMEGYTFEDKALISV